MNPEEISPITGGHEDSLYRSHVKGLRQTGAAQIHSDSRKNCLEVHRNFAE
ncbi:hypothetical protein PHLCEN_2v1393 [Hermanssonia centrifuga]|uniref:Uncharacterized protein n=1 Tax=Hermanssonia centrifuga TaxID=98765 RepID=A0A2R6S3B0_9APHY|nr:hypothetical protein PHLCEN_2v1393 [Hermanssonia centrifuga]